MDKLIDLVADKAGISKTQATLAVEFVLKFLKERLPEPIAGQLDVLVEGSDGFNLEKGMDLLSGLLGKK